jgi:hypothetical protein
MCHQFSQHTSSRRHITEEEMKVEEQRSEEWEE